MKAYTIGLGMLLASAAVTCFSAGAREPGTMGIGPVEPLERLGREIKSSTRACDADKGPCLIRMTLSGKHCVADAPTVNVKTASAGSPPLAITWGLVDENDRPIDKLSDKPLAFHPDAGIIIVYDDTSPPQISRGSPTANPRLHQMKTTRSVMKAEAGYLPVIMWGDPRKEELCAAVDPKIVNG